VSWSLLRTNSIIFHAACCLSLNFLAWNDTRGAAQRTFFFLCFAFSGQISLRISEWAASLRTAEANRVEHLSCVDLITSKPLSELYNLLQMKNSYTSPSLPVIEHSLASKPIPRSSAMPVSRSSEVRPFGRETSRKPILRDISCLDRSRINNVPHAVVYGLS